MCTIVHQGMYFQNFQNTQNISLLILYAIYHAQIYTAGITDTKLCTIEFLGKYTSHTPYD